MTRVFIGGSRRITRLPIPVRRRLDRIVEQSLPVVIGDANGADKAVQCYLRDQQHADVVVFARRLVSPQQRGRVAGSDGALGP